MIEIKNRHTGKVLYSVDADSLRGADLQGAGLHNALLRGADLWCADLRDANLRDADLRDIDLWAADLRGARVEGARFNWKSHDLLSAVLLSAAGEDTKRQELARFVLLRRDWCWEHFLALEHPQREWALRTLRAYDDGEAPSELEAAWEALP